MRKFLLPLIALGMLSFALLHVVRAQQKGPEVGPPVDPARSPFARTVAGSGIVEARTENIEIGAPVSGIVTAVHVKVGQEVYPGDPLFELDDRPLKAELAFRKAALASARTQLERLRNQPRAEERAIAEARVREAEVNLADQKDLWDRARSLYQRSAIGEEDYERRRHAHALAQEQLRRAKAEFDLTDRGAWEWDRAVAAAAVDQAQAQLDQTTIDLDRLVVRALVPGRVLQVNVHPGEFAGTPPGRTLVLLGDVEIRHVRVDIDENDIHRFEPGVRARAHLRGAPQKEYPLTFVRVEPYVVPKRSLTGESRERVDTRVLQVIYAMEKGADVYVGQQLDVFIESGNGALSR